MADISLSHRPKTRTLAPSPGLATALSNPANVIEKLSAIDYKSILDCEKWTREETELVVKLASDCYPLPIDWASISVRLPKFTKSECRERYHDACSIIASRASRAQENVKICSKKSTKRNTKLKKLIWQPEGFQTWIESRKSAWKRIICDPNAYYMEYPKPGVPLSVCDWSQDEISLFELLLVERPPEGQWGLFSMFFPHRTGQQCQALCDSMKLSAKCRKTKRCEQRTISNKKQKGASISTSTERRADVPIESLESGHHLDSDSLHANIEAETPKFEVVTEVIPVPAQTIVNEGLLLGSSTLLPYDLTQTIACTAQASDEGYIQSNASDSNDLASRNFHLTQTEPVSAARTEESAFFSSDVTISNDWSQDNCEISPNDEAVPALPERIEQPDFIESNPSGSEVAASVTCIHYFALNASAPVAFEEQLDARVCHLNEGTHDCDENAVEQGPVVCSRKELEATSDAPLVQNNCASASAQNIKKHIGFEENQINEHDAHSVPDSPKSFNQVPTCPSSPVLPPVPKGDDEVCVHIAGVSSVATVSVASAVVKAFPSDAAIQETVKNLKSQFAVESKKLYVGFVNFSERLKLVYRNRIAQSRNPEAHLMLLSDFSDEAADMMLLMRMQSECLASTQICRARRYIELGLIEIPRTPIPDMQL